MNKRGLGDFMNKRGLGDFMNKRGLGDKLKNSAWTIDNQKVTSTISPLIHLLWIFHCCIMK